jgi:hypothetical protein
MDRRKALAATHDRIATQRILSVPTTDGSSEAVEGACPQARAATSCSQRTFTALNAADSLPKERRRTAGSNPSNLSVSFQKHRNFANVAKWLRKKRNAFIGVKTP